MVANSAHRAGHYRRAVPAHYVFPCNSRLYRQIDSMDIQRLMVAYLRAVPTNQNDNRENQGKTRLKSFRHIPRRSVRKVGVGCK